MSSLRPPIKSRGLQIKEDKILSNGSIFHYSEERMYTNDKNRTRKIKITCGLCFQTRWRSTKKISSVTGLCRSCSQKGGKGNNWVDGRQRTQFGYIRIHFAALNEEDLELARLSSTKLAKRIAEHRLVMAKYLKRPLLKSEIVHHKNGIKDDNRIENLELTTNHKHPRIEQNRYARQACEILRLQKLLEANGIPY